MPESPAYAAYKRRLHRNLALYVAALAAFLLLVAWAEQAGMNEQQLADLLRDDHDDAPRLADV